MSTLTLLKIKKHPSVCAAEQQEGFQNAALLGKNYSGHLSLPQFLPLRAPRNLPRSTKSPWSCRAPHRSRPAGFSVIPGFPVVSS